MTEPISQAKQTLRQQMRQQLAVLTATTRATAATALCARITAAKIWREAKSVLLFAPLPDEPDLWPLLGQGLAENKHCALPSYVPATGVYVARRIADPVRDLATGKFGIREGAESCPEIPLNQLDLVLVPGVAFDAHGRRLGRGKGFYDRLLAGVRGTKCGVAFEEQLVPAVPVGPHDISLNCILTPARWIET
jgi:5-formyltetrahydrofolate cyclo-ligase